MTKFLYKNQIGGHHLLLHRQKQSSQIYKETYERECNFYDYIFNSDGNMNVIKNYVPRYFGSIQNNKNMTNFSCSSLDDFYNENTEINKSEYFIILEDLCHKYKNPCILDIKLGTRQFGLNCNEDKIKRKIYKSKISLTEKYGFRIAGCKYNNNNYNKRDCLTFSYEQTKNLILDFCNNNSDLANVFLQKISVFLDDIKNINEFFNIYTSSLLLLYDSENMIETAKITMIDFAHTYFTDEIRFAKNKNKEEIFDDGYLFGVKNLIYIFNTLKNIE
jgi:hypothetical protein